MATTSDNASVVLGGLTSPAAVRAAIAECDRIGRDAFLEEYGFKQAAEYFVRYNGAEYDSKAIAAVAYGYQYGRPPLAWDQCQAGKLEGRAGWALDRLGFEVVGIKHIGWWIDEVENTLDAYFDMFALVRAGQTFKKADYLRRLHQAGPTRTYKAYEYKLQNISAALRDLGHAWLLGYAPKKRYQLLVRFCLEDRLGRPHAPAKARPPEAASAHATRIVKIDWARRDAENRALGIAGEKYIFERERQRLIEADKATLATQVKWNAQDADGHGYDISSFEPDGSPLYIEVKTTTRGADTAFFLSSNELAASKHLGEQYRLYRVFNFLSSPDVTVYHGALDGCMVLTPSTYRAKPK